jgi:hypothetical protein
MQYSGVASPMLAAADFLDAKIQPIAPPYSDQQTPSPICGATLGMNSSQNPAALSLSQGGTFTNLFPAQRGGRMVSRIRKVHITHRKNRKNRKSLKQRGGAAAYPDAFGARLPADLVDLSRTAGLDKALADLPQFTGTYGLQTGGRRNRKNRKNSRKSRKASRKSRKASRKNRKNSRKASRKQRGGAYGDEAMSVADSSKLLLSPEMERFAFVNPQFYNENVVNPNFVAPYSAYIASQK